MMSRQNTKETYKRRRGMLLAAGLLLAMAPAPLAAKAESTEHCQIMVSLGDSYSSGEGIEPFYGQDADISEKVNDPDWLAHRSQNSWPGMLMLPSVDGTMAENRGTYWYFAAASGAVTANLQNTQCKEYDKQWSKYTGSYDLAPQLEIFDALGENKADYVTLTLGGNDVDFAGIIQEAAVGSSYLSPNHLTDKINDTWKEFYKDGGIQDNLRQAYEDIAEKAGAQAQIVVAGYPQLLDWSGKGALFSLSEAVTINEAVKNFNAAIENIIYNCAASGMKICFASVEDAFRGHEAYSKDPYINSIMLTQSEDINDKISFSTIGNVVSSYSIHPNYEGACAYARCVQAKIDELEANAEKQDQMPVRTTSDERDIVLLLDVSGSMSGTPIEETRKAAVNFIGTVLAEDASIGIVTYNSSADLISDFSVDEEFLKDAAMGIRDGGGTNIEIGLLRAYGMLCSSNAKKQIIVLMSDGEPNEGKIGDDLVAYADELKEDGILIYTLGFFENMGGGKASAQRLMERIASDGCHYEVASAEDLVFFFEDVADQINGQRYIYIRIACPVDVTVTYDGESLCSAEEDLNTRTSFGTLSFEENEESAYASDDRVKVLRLKEGAGYDIQIVGTGRGIMNYTIGFMDENGDYGDFRVFEDVKITKKTVIDTEAAVSDETILRIDSDGDGKYDLKLRAEENGYGEEVGQMPWMMLAVGGAAVILVILAMATWKLRKKKRGEVD